MLQCKACDCLNEASGHRKKMLCTCGVAVAGFAIYIKAYHAGSCLHKQAVFCYFQVTWEASCVCTFPKCTPLKTFPR